MDLKRRLVEFFGRNFTVIYQEKFNFQEQWQINQPSLDSVQNGKIENSIPIALVLLIILVNSCLIWYRTVNFFFQEKERINEDNPIY
jgi:hypothetical protein